MTLTRTSSLEIFSSEVLTASAEPCTSALTMMFRVFISPAWIWLKRSSRLTFLVPGMALLEAAMRRSSASSRAMRSSATALNTSPALGTSDRPEISTGVEGPASVTR